MVSLRPAAEDLGISLEELHLALEELETANQELAVSKPDADAETEIRRYRDLFELVPAACLITNADGTVVEANRAAEALLGRRARYLIGKPLAVFIAGSETGRFFALLDRVRGGGEQSVEAELIFRSSDERRFTVGLTACPIRDPAGELTGARWLVRDLTQQIRREREQRERRDREAYRHVADGVIHHVNNLLGAIRGYAEILCGLRDLDARVRRPAERIQAATERGERLTSGLLAFAHPGGRSSGSFPVVAAVLEACETARQSAPPGVCVGFQPGGSSARSVVDGTDLYLAVLNLIQNACDAVAGDGEVVVTTEIVEVDAGDAERLDLDAGPYVAIRVTDGGSGMDPDTRAHALEPFFSTKAISEGFGLGLPTAEAIARQAHGGLDVRTEPGAGTEVTLYLPQCAGVVPD